MDSKGYMYQLLGLKKTEYNYLIGASFVVVNNHVNNITTQITRILIIPSSKPNLQTFAMKVIIGILAIQAVHSDLIHQFIDL